MDMLRLFDDVSASLEKMEAEGKVDLGIVDKLDALAEEGRRLENFWGTAKSVGITDAFVLFHASRNSRLVVEKLRSRLIAADGADENPSVLADAAKVIPPLHTLFLTLTFLKEKPITPNPISLVSGRLRTMRAIAAGASMLPSIGEEIQGLERQYVKERFKIFTRGVRETLVEA